MPDEELTVILRLRDEATKQMASARAERSSQPAPRLRRRVSRLGRSGTMPPRPSSPAQGPQGRNCRASRKAASAVADLNTVFGDTGPKLQAAAAAVLKTSNAFGDLDVAGLGESMKLFGRDITDVNTTLDTFTHVSQASGAPVGALISQVRTFGPVFKNANISLDETVGFMGAMETAGVDITRVMPAINASLRKAAVGGVTDLRGHLGGLIESIRDTESGTDALKIATKAFGAEGAQRMTAAIRSGALPALDELSTMFGDTTGAVERTYDAGKTWRDTLIEMKDGAAAYLGPGGDMVGAIGSAASGLALAGPQMLNWVRGIKLAALANAALTSSFLPVTIAIAAVFAAWKVGNIEGVKNKIAEWTLRIQGFTKAEAAAAVAATAAAVAASEQAKETSNAIGPTEDLDAAIRDAEEASSALAAALAGGEVGSVVSSLDDTATAADDAAEAIKDAATAAASAKLNDFYKLQADTRADIADDTAWLKQQQADRVADVQAAESQKLADFYAMQQTTRTALAADSAWLVDLYTTTGTASSAGFLNSMTSTFADAFAGGGGFMGGLQSVMTQGWGKLFVGEGETAAGGFLGKMQGVMGALGGVPLVGPLLAAFGPALIGGIGKLAGKIWGGIKSLFGGPSEQEQLGRDLFANFHAGIAPELKNSEAYIAGVQEAIAAGWDSTLAETAIAFKQTAVAAGLSADDGFAAYEAYQNAVKAGNTDLMKKLEGDYAEWERMASETASANTTASDESTADIVADAAEIGAQFKGLTATEAAELGAALINLGSKANQAFSDIHSSAIAAGNALANRLLPHILSVSSAIRNMPKDITIRQRYVTEGEKITARQHGGPVSAGVPYLVGERGPEMFVPGSSGSVASNKSIPTAEEIGAAVTAALHRVPLVVPQDAVTDAMLRNAPRRQALHGTT